MSNSVLTRLSIFGETRQVEELINILHGFDDISQSDSLLNLAATVPLPEDDVEREWYDLNWGTKFIDLDEDSVWVDCAEGKYLDFYADGMPPVEWLRTTAKQYGSLRFELRYSDSGNATYGFFVCEGDAFEDHDISLLFLETLVKTFKDVDLTDSSAVYEKLKSLPEPFASTVELLMVEYDVDGTDLDSEDSLFNELVGVIESAEDYYEHMRPSLSSSSFLGAIKAFIFRK